MNTPALKLILKNQESWARSRNLFLYTEGRWHGHTESLADNLLYKTLSTITVNEYASGQGNELKSHMRALCSSSALVVNLFEYWRQIQKIGTIAEYCGAGNEFTGMFFEKKHRIPHLGTPNLDIEFIGEQGKPFAIEAKFTEPYRVTTQRNKTNLEKYLTQDNVWYKNGGCKKLANDIVKEEGKLTSWKHLDAPQLVKHTLGLSCCYQPGGFTLMYLWFDCATEESRELEREISIFKNMVRGEIDFRSMTYQTLFEKVRTSPYANDTYVQYLHERYFSLPSKDVT